MAGGVGNRFWPLSTPEYPKQFIDILGSGRTLIQLIVDRFKGVAPIENFWVVTNAKYVKIVKEQIPGIPESHILAEPEARNTAPSIAWACWKIKAEDENANIVVTPSDAVVMNPEEFRCVIQNSLNFTSNHDAIVTIGIKPSRPETGYGYVEVKVESLVESVESSNTVQSSEIKRVQEFKEKPNYETAEKYLKASNYLWNAGIFVWNVQTIANSIRTYKPILATQMDEIVNSESPNSIHATDAKPYTLNSKLKEVFPQCEKISIDYAVMEPASKDGKVFTHPADFGWSDLGNWASLHAKLQKDENGNGSVGNVKLYECRDCVVHMEDARKVVLQGLDSYIVSEKNGQFLVCKRSEEQRIRDFSSN
ncbi:MAG: mannose-1-phosphate guanylyltransferase [Bacteroidales bacterium]|nr:mannose-1-phosphate guanylyltransferase [Bacteroidales bacterium]